MARHLVGSSQIKTVSAVSIGDPCPVREACLILSEPQQWSINQGYLWPLCSAASLSQLLSFLVLSAHNEFCSFLERFSYLETELRYLICYSHGILFYCFVATKLKRKHSCSHRSVCFCSISCELKRKPSLYHWFITFKRSETIMANC